jgi:predicted Zn-dependent protease
VILCSIFPIGAPAFGQLDLLKKAADVGAGLADLKISEEEEIQLGQAISRKIRERYGVVQDRDETRYLSMVGLMVARKTDRPHLPYRFIILDSGSVNAFAVPGGIVQITRGALAAIGSEEEFAGVLGHEVAHITLKHTIKAIKKDKSIDVASSASGLDDNVLMAKLADRATDMVLAGYGREQEVNSDQAGVVFAAGAGYSQEGLLRFLDS